MLINKKIHTTNILYYLQIKRESIYINTIFLKFKNFTILPMRYFFKKKKNSLSLSLNNCQKLNPIGSHPRLSLPEKYNHHHISLLRVELFNVPFIITVICSRYKSEISFHFDYEFHYNITPRCHSTRTYYYKHFNVYIYTSIVIALMKFHWADKGPYCQFRYWELIILYDW